jgi:hypothetical protein
MKQVIIGFKDGKPYVMSSPKKIEIIFKTEKKRTIKKVLRTWLYQFKTALGM